MRPSTRIFIGAIVLEALLIAGAVYMVTQVTSGAWQTFDQADAVNRIMTVMGAAIGGFGAVFFFLAGVLRWKGR